MAHGNGPRPVVESGQGSDLFPASRHLPATAFLPLERPRFEPSVRGRFEQVCFPALGGAFSLCLIGCRAVGPVITVPRRALWVTPRLRMHRSSWGRDAFFPRTCNGPWLETV